MSDTTRNEHLDDGAAHGIAATSLDAPAPGIALWWCRLSIAEPERIPLGWLSLAEQARMARLGTEALRFRYAIGRASLRWILARELGMAPAAVPIVRGARGRPWVQTDGDVDFNVSHTADVALIAVARGIRIGVDIEREDRVVNAPGIARKFLTTRERASLDATRADWSRRRILRLWTCKESMSKATGDALSAPFARMDVELVPVLRLADGPAPYRPDDFTLLAAHVPSGYFGTVAIWRASNIDPAADAESAED